MHPEASWNPKVGNQPTIIVRLEPKVLRWNKIGCTMCKWVQRRDTVRVVDSAVETTWVEAENWLQAVFSPQQSLAIDR